MLSLLLTSITIILAPLYIIRSFFALPTDNLPAIPTTLLEVLIIITFFTTIFSFIKRREKFSILKTKFDLLIFVFLTSAVVALFTSYNFYGGLGILRAYFIEPIIFYYILIYQLRKNGNKLILNSLIASGVWLSVLSIMQKITGNYSLAPNEISQGRVSAVYNSANSLALYLGPIIILTFSQILNYKSTKKFIYIGLLMLFILTLVFTRSRGGEIGIISAFLSFGYFILIQKNKLLLRFWYVLPVIIASILIFISIIYYNTYSFLPPTFGKAYSGGDTLQIRYFIWSGTINMIKNNPIFGAGLNGFKTLYTNQYRLPEFQEEFQYPHNIFLTFWAETGLFGLFSFLLLSFSAMSLVIRNLKIKNKYFGLGLLTIFIYWFVHGLVDVPYFKNDLSLEYWVILAFIEYWSTKN